MQMKSMMAATALLPIVSFGGIYDEALIWFRGGHDANGDGVLQVRHTGGPTPWWGSMRGLRLKVQDVPVSLPEGFSILLT